jgi:hypothetical protein
VGQKRGREEAAALDPKKQFITRLLRLGQPGQLSDVSVTSSNAAAQRGGAANDWVQSSLLLQYLSALRVPAVK